MIVNNTFVGNLASGSGGALYNCTNMICNNIIWGNGEPPLSLCSTPRNCCINGAAYVYYGNTNVDPKFVSTSDLRLQPDSVCINAGKNTSNSGTQDLWGDPRVIGGVADMGAYEFGTTGSMMRVAPASITFPNTFRGETSVAEVIVGNLGDESFTAGASALGTGFRLLDASSFIVPAYSCHVATIGFTPQALGNYNNGSATFTGAGGAAVPLAGVLTFETTTPYLYLHTNAVQFPSAFPLETSSASLYVANWGQETMFGYVTNFGAPFSLVSGSPFAVAGLRYTNITFRFSPTMEGYFNDWATIVVSGVTSYSFLLTGDTVPEPLCGIPVLLAILLRRRTSPKATLRPPRPRVVGE